jgi:hypothetical protein
MKSNHPLCLALVLFLAAAAAGETMTMMQSSFTGGELSPLAQGRLDAPRYYQSVAALENMIALPQGPAVRRPGTIFAGATDSNNVARLLPFRYSADDVYVLEFTDAQMRVFRNHGLVNDSNGIYVLSTPFDANEIGSLQLWQSADVCYLVDGTDWPQKLVRADHNDWSIAAAPIDDGPFLAENLTGTTIAASATTGSDVNLVASAPLWAVGHVGSYWRLRDLVAIQTVSGTFTDGNTPSTALTCQAGNSFQWSISGNWVGTCELQISYDDGSSWTAYAVITSTANAATTETVYPNDTGQDIQVRAAWATYTSGAVAYRVWVHAYMHTGVVQITDVNDPCNASATVIRTLASTTATVRWSEGAWSGVRGYPRAIASYSDRLVFASTTHQPLTIWFSATGRYETFDPGTGLDDESFAYTLGRAAQDPILWLVNTQRRGLIAGTTGALMELVPLDAASAITPSNPPTVSNTLAIPAAALPPVLADNVLLMVQRNSRKIREVLYSVDADALVAPDLTLFADHVTAGGVTALAWMTQPYTLLWAARTDGTLLALTYDRNYQVVAWSRHTLGGAGAVESLCAVPGTGGDELWLAVRRTVDANTVRYVEYLAPWDCGTDPCDAHFVDSGLSYDAAAATVFSGLGHLAGKTVAVLADGEPLTGVVATNSVTLANAASVVHVGLPYTSTLTTLRYDVSGPQGTTWARAKAIKKATISFYQTLGAQVGPDVDHLVEPPWGALGAPVYEGVPDLFSGDRELTFSSGFGTDKASLMIRQTQPWPLTVRAIVATVEVR